ncbi:hypothetical protein GNX71_13015 [Variovorax sp. RKNM96]|uniref:hypothetical protein n=1 Tax=Variovorax sp. RKNM96 TaxID=2681552 RepID=UPI00197D638E|nr:hypothetical protein [Variovorax sp. RKNM96]QSI30454.1 hypothetical protein GNX71_13015 [Variovorax sp. RKNM96]
MNWPHRKLDPMPELRKRFINGIRGQIKRLDKLSTKPSSRDWFEILEEKNGSGLKKCVAWLRNGSKFMPLAEGATYMKFDSTYAVTDFYRAAMHACERGELDEFLVASSAKARRE